ncbi:hypothetical protein GOP47_0010444 [Adiantum capillus-veneris]|uniref:Uncharacterized protein n=1 Tax=Adiantum capillus-veneris TaxID=13818 RepID=A0A9D4ZGC9_ADICA|nr:hypothetical protein GOP47_0010444 [Adiantum capillus-veneris]
MEFQEQKEARRRSAGGHWADENEAVRTRPQQRRQVLLRHQHVLPSLRQPFADIAHLITKDEAERGASLRSTHTLSSQCPALACRKRLHSQCSANLTQRRSKEAKRLSLSLLR